MNNTSNALWLKGHSSYLRYDDFLLSTLPDQKFFFADPVDVPKGWHQKIVEGLPEIDGIDIDGDAFQTLMAFDWNAPIVQKEFSFINGYFDHVILTIESPQLTAFLSDFEGVVYICFPTFSANTVRKNVREFTPHIINKIRQAGDRVKFISLLDADEFSFDQLLSRRILKIPLSCHITPAEDGIYVDRDIDVLIVSNEERLNPAGRARREQLEKLYSGFNVQVTGYQSIPVSYIDNYINVDGAVGFRALCNNSKVVLSTGISPNLGSDFWLLEALSCQTPLLVLSADLFDNAKLIDAASIVKNTKQLQRVSKKLIKGGVRYRNKLVSGKIDHIKKITKPPAFESLLKALKCKDPQNIEGSRRKARVGIFSAGGVHSTEYFNAKQFYRLLLADSDDTADLVLFVKDEPEYQIPIKDAADYEIRSFSWDQVSLEETGAALKFIGAEVKQSYASFVFPDDNLNGCYDCDVWIFLSDLLPGHLLQLKPTLFFAGQYQHGRCYLGNSSVDRIVDYKVQNIISSEAVFVTNAESRNRVEQSIPSESVQLLSLPAVNPNITLECEELGLDEHGQDDYLLVFTEGLDATIAGDFLYKLAYLYLEGGYQLPTMLVGVSAEDVDTIIRSYSQLVNDSALLANASKFFRKSKFIKFRSSVSLEIRDRLIQQCEALVHLDATSGQSLNAVIADRHDKQILMIESGFNRELRREVIVDDCCIDDLYGDNFEQVLRQLLSGNHPRLNKQRSRSVSTDSFDIKAASRLYWEAISRWL